MPVEGLHSFYYLVDIVGAVGVIHLFDVFWIYRIQLQDVVVHLHQGIVHLLPVYHG